MNIEQERKAFNTWWFRETRPVDRSLAAFNAAERAWKARAALQSQDREDAERLDWLEALGSVDIVRTLDNKTEVYAPDNDLVYAAARNLREAIDHARRIEGDGK